MTKKNYSLSTGDKAAFDRLVEACAGLGSFQMLVVEVKEPPQASKPPPFVPHWNENAASGGRTDGKEG